MLPTHVLLARQQPPALQPVAPKALHAPTQAPLLHTGVAGVATAHDGPAVHTPARQVSGCVQALLSALHAVPSPLAVYVHAPVVGLQVPGDT